VDKITFSAAANTKDAHTATAILGPFFRKDAPHYPNGGSIIKTMPADGQVTYMHGRCVDSVTGKGIPGVVVDVWEDSTNGLYEQQDPDQEDCNLRGRFTTDEEGQYSWYCLRPTPYPIPYDGPAGKVLQLLDRHPMRPAHIHLIVSFLPTLSPFMAVKLTSCRQHTRSTCPSPPRSSTTPALT
jgi:catechol 1,2-dioxygenase